MGPESRELGWSFALPRSVPSRVRHSARLLRVLSGLYLTSFEPAVQPQRSWLRRMLPGTCTFRSLASSVKDQTHPQSARPSHLAGCGQCGFESRSNPGRDWLPDQGVQEAMISRRQNLKDQVNCEMYYLTVYQPGDVASNSAMAVALRGRSCQLYWCQLPSPTLFDPWGKAERQRGKGGKESKRTNKRQETDSDSRHVQRPTARRRGSGGAWSMVRVQHTSP